MLLGLWLCGGLTSLVGSLCYAELASTHLREGGDYVYLSQAYGRWAGFLFGMRWQFVPDLRAFVFFV